MSEYELKFLDPDFTSTEEEQQRQRTIGELSALIQTMKDRALAVVNLDELQSDRWDQPGGFDYQDYYGQEIINQVADGTTETLVINNIWGLPVALAARNNEGRWEGLGVDVRLRETILHMLERTLG